MLRNSSSTQRLNLMTTRALLGMTLLAALSLAGCGGTDSKHGTGGGQGTGGGTGGGGGAGIGQHLKLMNEASELALKILAERESGKSVTEVNQKYAEQVTAIDAQIAKLPKLTAEQESKVMQAYAGKPREVEMKFSALAEKGTLHETGKLLKLPNYALGEVEAPK
jgi:hypothetical protein